MIKYAITGNIASGKSAVEQILISMGFPVLDTDLVAHKILMQSDEIKSIFRDYDVFSADGEINRSKLGKLVFSDSMLKKTLEDVIHPEINKEINNFFNRNLNEKKVFVSIPLLFECNLENMFDKIILVYADDETRLKRLILRNKYTEDYAKTRMQSQKSQDEKIKLSDIVIYNDGSLEDLKIKILKSFG